MTDLKYYNFLQEQIDTLALSLHSHDDIPTSNKLQQLQHLAKQRQQEREDLRQARLRKINLETELDKLLCDYPELG